MEKVFLLEIENKFERIGKCWDILLTPCNCATINSIIFLELLFLLLYGIITIMIWNYCMEILKNKKIIMRYKKEF